MIRLLHFCLLNFAFIIATAQTATEQWELRHNGTGDFSDKFNCIITHASGNIYLAGYSVKENNSRDLLVVKTNSAGDTLWARTYDGSGNGADEALAMIADLSGNVYVSGYQNGNGTGDDMLTVKYNSSGVLQWSEIYNYASNDDDRAVDMCFDSGGNIIITGFSDSDGSAWSELDDIVTVKYSTGGTQLYAARYNGAANSYDKAAGVSADGSGSIFVTGTSANATDEDIVTIKYNSSLTQQWAVTYSSGNWEKPADIAVDLSGNVLVCGRRDNGSDDDYITLKYDNGGTQQWAKLFNGSANENDKAKALLTDSVGNVFVTGRSDADASSNQNYNIVTIKYDGGGNQIWAATYAGATGQNDLPTCIYRSAGGSIIVGGQTDVDPSANISYDALVVKYDAAGIQQWAQTFNGTANNDDFINAVSGNGGNIYAAGNSQSTASQKDGIFINFDTGGNTVWQKTFSSVGDNNDNANDMHTDYFGNSYVGGYSVNIDKDRDFLVMKINSTGDTVWTKTFDGTSEGADEAEAITAVLSPNEAIATGFTKNRGTSFDITTIRFASYGDTLWMKKFNGSANGPDRGVDITTDATGNIYVTGTTDVNAADLENLDIITIKYSPTGNIIWTKTFNGSGNGDDRPVQIKIGPTGNIYVCGKTWNGGNDDVVLILYDPNGNVLWQKIWNSFTGEDRPAGIAVDNAQNAYITAHKPNPSGVDNDIVTLKYDPFGTLAWSVTYSNTLYGNDEPSGIALDMNGDIYVSAKTDTDGTYPAIDYDYLLIKYSQNGAPLWIKTFDGTAGGDDYTSAIACDSADNVYITGKVNNGSVSIPNFDYVTLKYDTLGNFIWSGTKNGTGNAEDSPSCISISNNNVFVAGSSIGTGTAQKDVLVLKYNNFPTSVNEQQPEGDSLIYPNPSAGIFYLLGMNKKDQIIEIYNSIGKMIFQSEIENQQSEINLSSQPPGIYFLRLNNRLAGKLIVVR